MPIIEIQALVASPPDLPTLLSETASAVADAFATDIRTCWVTFREIAPGAYFEGGQVRDAADAAEVAPIVTVIAHQGRSAEQKGEVLRAIAVAVGRALGSDPDNVFVEYREIPEGHVHSGGRVF